MMISFARKSLVHGIWFVVVVLAIIVVAAGDEISPEPAMFPAMFVFGDSLVDNGNNNRLNSLARSNYFPYGIDFDGGQPTGRFSNGKTIVDFIGELIGLPGIPAFMETVDGGVDVLRGVNYASAAGGILEETGQHLGERFSMRRQVENFEKTLMEISRGRESVKEYMAKSLVVVSLGNNDYINNYLKPSLFLTSSIYDPPSFADLLLSNFTYHLLELYEKGFRKFVLAGVGPLGCIPDQLAVRAVPPGECVEAVNEMAELFNNRLKSLVDRLNSDDKTARDAIFVYGNTYGAAVDILTNPFAYGFEVTDRGCCGVGRNRGEITCLPLAVPCVLRDRHVFWDAFHPTQAFNVIIALRAFNGSKSDCYPINLSQIKAQIQIREAQNKASDWRGRLRKKISLGIHTSDHFILSGVMETEAVVRTVAGVDCFVSLPRQILHVLQSTSSSPLPPLLPVELRSGDRRWPVAWSGSSSSSSAIEVARVFAESISLPDGTVVQVRVLSNVPKATLVTVEPETEDDWEVLELNAELAEAAILSQVRILHETMKFPLWLHDRSVIRFAVVSTFPPKGVVQLVPGSEVAVAPKRRERNLNAKKGSDAFDSEKECNNVKVLLRVQDTNRSAFHEADVKGFDVRVALTSIAYIHPETAKKYSLESLQMISVSPRIPLKGSAKKDEALDMRNSEASKVVENGTQSAKKDPRRAILRLVFSDLAAKGHIMMVESLRLYLGAGLHSWVHLRGCSENLKKEIPALSLSPCVLDRGTDMLGNHISNRKSSHPLSGLTTNVDVVDWSVHEKVVTALSSEDLHIKGEEDNAYQLKNKKGLECLTRLWSLAQLDAIASVKGVDVSSVIVGRETLFHFEVRGLESCKSTDGQPSVNDRLERKKEKNVPLEILYVMTVSDESSLGDNFAVYELTLDRSEKKDNVEHIEPVLEKMNLDEPIIFSSAKERHCNKGVSPDISSLAWMGSIVSDVIKRMTVLLSPAAGMWFSKFNIPSPGHVLIYGPPGSGKTILARAAAKYFEEQKDLLAHVILVSCSALALEKVQHIRQVLSSVIAEGLEHAPSVIILDDLDSIISSSSDNEGTQASNAVTMLTKFLTDIIDDYKEYRTSSCGIGPLAFVASVQSLENIPQTLSSSGRFDFHVQLAAPATTERGAILKHEIQKRLLECSEDILLELAAKCEGYDAYDLEILVDRAVHAAIGRHLPCKSNISKYHLVKEDFTRAMHEFVPVAMRDITKSASEGGRSGWEDVGGVTDIKNAIKEMIELPSRFPKIFAKSPLRLRSNVLLYGPPGCGKTHIVGAAAAACSLRFISVKGPELLNKYIGASEQAAAAAAPCLLFFDEFDSIAPKRGHDNTGVTDRVVNQFLTELDGVEVLTGVFVFAATSRPDLLDPALLRPGRLDRLLMCDFPSPPERLEILTVLSRKLPMAGDVDLDPIAQMTEGFSGADLQALLSDAQLAAVHEFLNREDKPETGTTPIITDPLLKSIASKTKPSVSETEKQKLYDIYSQFLDSRKSSREAKGKRATLA
ncbi:unnamed protein product [Thlaspi arvense]|uniref:Peroxisomal ATPase PEX1 n=1 Tax=Thlaspi arvense TaxID=13288 RepID=A0AAU9SVB1_THLAR|nr:unnamed protein product [Thlaspi arvense]